MAIIPILTEKSLIETADSIRQRFGYADGYLIQCIENGGIYKYDSTSEANDDGDTVIRPVMTGVGRWLKVKEFQLTNF